MSPSSSFQSGKFSRLSQTDTIRIPEKTCLVNENYLNKNVKIFLTNNPTLDTKHKKLELSRKFWKLITNWKKIEMEENPNTQPPRKHKT